ncbi:MAG: stage 0 sporulation family protein [Clostridia bacterium]|nr:stage 0 sporulation family protein [Clostridia bacterium]
MIKVTGVRFKNVGKIYYFAPGNLDLQKDDHVIVETARGIEFGTVVLVPREVEDKEVVSPLKEVIRIATQEDCDRVKENQIREREAFAACLEKIRQHKIEMKLVDVEYTFDNNKILFYFTAEGRVDFRELVKDLASIFRTRIELRQIGIRDEAKILGGVGICGRALCCNTFLDEFQPVSIKMAKDQSLSLNPTKISGICSRLMCCLKYEHEAYQELLDQTPSAGSIVKTEDGQGEILSVSLLKGRIRVKIPKKDDIEIKEYSLKDVKIIRWARNAKNNALIIDEDEDKIKKLED